VFDVQRRFIDYAAEMGWNYTLIDAGWDVQIGRERIPALVAHGAARGVGVLLWYNSAGSWNETPLTPRDLMTERASRRAEFAWLRDIGVKGVKVDFFGGDGQSVIRYYLDILQDAAEFGLLVNFHGSTLPRGWQRSWPHLMTMEAVKGLEFTTFGQPDQDAVASHAAMLPFARNLFDPMDFTPLVFGDIPGIARRTRNGFELAEAVLFTSGIQHYAEVPTGMASVPEAARLTLRALPRSWDETRFITGVPGQHVVLARRSGSRWHVAGLNAGKQPLTLTLDLGFLAGQTGRMISDGRGPRELAQGRLAASRQTRVRLAAHGGFVAVFDSGQAAKDGAH
ncbi:glycoside hydrolase family 97 catalytic domain-containing protein, partial [Ideonella sp.]|uniref:glycoside hydrolase family 97 catalytic domain-containing protein n=1 Tax=Ideonella sp. TaxID=1929293 RepID=UPI003BB5E472